MLLTKDQKLLLEILEKFGSLRKDQIEFLLRHEYSWVQTEKTYKILSMYGHIKIYGNTVSFPDKSFDTKTIDAVDIMVNIAGESLVQYQKGNEPFLVTFFKEKDGKLWRYDVCSVAFGTEIVINADLENINTKYRKIIFLLEREEQIPALHVNCEHFFAIKQNNKFHYFRKGEN